LPYLSLLSFSLFLGSSSYILNIITSFILCKGGRASPKKAIFLNRYTLSRDNLGDTRLVSRGDWVWIWFSDSNLFGLEKLSDEE
jgi:hypothetical protein